MVIRLVNLRRFAVVLRRYGAIATSAAIVIVVLAALATTGLSMHRSDEALAASLRATSAVERAGAALDRLQRGLDEIARVAATRPDAAVRQFLDQLPLLAPGIRGGALIDAAGTVQLRSANALDEMALAALATDAAKETAAHQNAAMRVTRTLRDGDTELVGLARALSDGDDRLAGVALIVADPAAFAGLDLMRDDGSPLFGQVQIASALRVGDFPLMLSSPRRTDASALRDGLPLIALAVLGAAGLLSLLAVLLARLNAAARQNARQAIAERELRKELSVAAAAVDRTDELNRTKSQFFAQVTHELRTPLNAILGFSETIRQEMFGPVANTRYLEYAGLIHEAGAHLLSLINDLLDNARVEAGKMEIAPIRVSAPALARSALDLVELLAEGRDIALAPAGLATCPDLNVDPRAMKQVLVNLLSNAIKYTPPGGRIELRFAACDDGGAAIAISDTGIGMSVADLRVAFEPFGRAGDLQARRQQGTGLGLSLARALVRLHGGDLTLVSQLDFGTTATVILPASAVFDMPKSAVFDMPNLSPAKAASEAAAKAA